MPNINKNKFHGVSILKALNIFLLAIVGLSALYPFWNIYVYAFNDAFDSLQRPLYFWPRKFTMNNLIVAFSNQQIYNSFVITIIKTLVGTAIGVLLTSALGYAMSKRMIPGYKFFSQYFYITFMFTGGFIPFYLLLNDLKMLNTFWVLVIPGIYSYWNMIIFRSFFDNIPASLEESAQIDGASYIGCFIKIIMPMSKPIFATIILFVAVGHWNDWFTGMFYIKDSNLLPLQTLLQEMLNQMDMVKTMKSQAAGPMLTSLISKVTPYSVRMAAIVITVTPIIFVYPFLQKYFEKGMILGSVKG